jgi:hypothetical protein
MSLGKEEISNEKIKWQKKMVDPTSTSNANFCAQCPCVWFDKLRPDG